MQAAKRKERLNYHILRLELVAQLDLSADWIPRDATGTQNDKNMSSDHFKCMEHKM